MAQPKQLSNQSFGLIFAAIFLVIGLFPILFGNPYRVWALTIALAFFSCSLIFPSVLTPLNNLWMKFGQLMHKITNPILMGIIFFLTVLPTGIVLKLLGRDPMRRRPDSKQESYWIERDKSKIESDFFDHQF